MNTTWGKWESYPWKNELVTQSERVTIHFQEVLSDSFEGEHRPFDMLDRAIVLSAFAVRRLIEKKLVTDRLSEATIDVRGFARNSIGDFREPFHFESGVYPLRENYDLEKEVFINLKYTDLANEIIHASQMMVIYNEPKISDGLLIASDWRLKDRILHMTIVEFQSFVRTVLDDRIRSTQDFFDDRTGKARSKRN
jgi:hypothetical protein